MKVKEIIVYVPPNQVKKKYTHCKPTLQSLQQHNCHVIITQITIKNIGEIF